MLAASFSWLCVRCLGCGRLYSKSDFFYLISGPGGQFVIDTKWAQTFIVDEQSPAVPFFQTKKGRFYGFSQGLNRLFVELINRTRLIGKVTG